MRALLSALALSVLGLSAPAASAQSCAPIQFFFFFMATGGDCRLAPEGGATHCGPGFPVRMEVQGHTGNPASCPLPVLTWNFGDGSAPLVTTDNIVEHTFPLGLSEVRVTSPNGSRVEQTWIRVGIWHGTYTIAPAGTVSEGAGKAKVTVSRNDATHASKIDYAAGPASAVTPVAGTLSFAAGESSKQIEIPLVQDTIFTGDRKATLTLSNPTNNYSMNWGSPSLETELLITDDEVPVEYICVDKKISAFEAQGKVTLTLARTGGFDVAGTGTFRIIPRGKHDGPVHEVALPAGAGTATFDLPIGDGVYTGNREYIVACSGWQGPVKPPTVPWGTQVLMTVVEDESYPTFKGSPLTITESEAALLEISASPAFGEGTTVSVKAIDGTAKQGTDFEPPCCMHFPSGVKTGKVAIVPVDDSVAEADEEFQVEIGNGTSRLKIRITIVDDDRPPHVLALEKESYQFDETKAAAVVVTRGGDTSGTTAGALRFVSPDGMPWPDDVAFELAPGETSKSVQFSMDDHWYTADRVGTMQLVTSGFVADGADVTVLENEAQPVLTVADVQVREGAAGQTTQVELLFLLSGAVGVDLEPEITTVHATADSADYDPFDDELLFAPGTLTRKVTVKVHGDGAVEPDETFQVAIGNCCGGMAALATRTATVTILDDDGTGGGGPGGGNGQYRIEEPFVTEWREDAKWLTAAIVRDDASAADNVTVRLTLDEARRFWPVTLRFRENQSRQKVRFYIDDHYYSGNAAGRLEVLDGTAMEDQQPVRIVEDENIPVVSSSDLEITEGVDDKSGAFIVTVVPPSFRPIRVRAICHPDKQSPDVIIPTETPLEIPSLVSSVPVPFTIVGDRLEEQDETFWIFLWLSEETPHARTGEGGLCTIHDDDRPNARLSFTSDRLPRGSSATARLILGDLAPAARTIRLTADGLSAPATVEIPAGAARVEFPVTGLALGEGVVRAEVPGGTIEERILVYTPGALSLPSGLTMNRGRTVEVALALAAAEEQPFNVTITSSDSKIAAPPMFAVIPAGGPGSFELNGVANGTAIITITLPPELGGTSFTLTVEVVDPVSKRRSLR